MQVPVQIPAVWVQTTSDLMNAFRPEGYLSFLTRAQAARLERIRQARLLYQGKHRQYFLDENRTQFDFARAVAGARPIQPYVTFNVLELITNTATDLLFGDEPLIRADSVYQQQSLTELSERCMLHALFSSAALGCNYEGEAFLESCIHENEVCLRQVNAEEVFPEGPILPNGQYGSYVRFNLKNIGTEQSPIYLMRQMRYLPGRITRECWQLDQQGKKQNQVALDAWVNGVDNPMPPDPAPVYGYDTGPIGYTDSGQTDQPIGNDPDPIPDQQLQPVTMTGITRNTITWVPHRVLNGQAVSSYDALLDLQDVLNASNTQLANIFAKHADPAVAFPQEAADDQGNIRAANKGYFYDDPDRIPRYVVWNAEVEAAMKNRDFNLQKLIVAAESSPLLLGVGSDTVKPNAFKSIKLMALKPLTASKRSAVFWTAGIRRALSVSQELECAVVPGTRYDLTPVQVTLQDGIPNDSLDKANEIAIYKQAGLMSRDRGVRLEIPDPAAADAELELLDKEDEASTPSTFFPGAPGAPAHATPDADPRAGASQTSDDPAAAASAGQDEKSDVQEEVAIS